MTFGKRDPSEFGGEDAGWSDDIMNPGPQPKPENLMSHLLRMIRRSKAPDKVSYPVS